MIYNLEIFVCDFFGSFVKIVYGCMVLLTEVNFVFGFAYGSAAGFSKIWFIFELELGSYSTEKNKTK
jgi:hypothetical protein